MERVDCLSWRTASLMMDAAAFAKVLQHASVLYDEAATIDHAYSGLAELEQRALRSWRGALADEMQSTRDPEEEADAQIAAASMRAEADLWAEFWAHEVDSRNLRVRDSVIEVVGNSLAFAAAMMPTPESIIAFPDRALIPSGPGFSGGAVFVRYVQIEQLEWKALYTWNP